MAAWRSSRPAARQRSHPRSTSTRPTPSNCPERTCRAKNSPWRSCPCNATNSDAHAASWCTTAAGSPHTPRVRTSARTASDAPSSGHQLPPLRTSTQPRTGEDLRRRSTRTRVDLRPALAATGLRLYFPHLAVGTDVHVTTPDQTTVAVPPMPLNLHPPTLQVPQAHRETVTILDGWAAPQAPGLPSRTAIRRPLTRYPTSDLTGLGDRRRRCPIPGEAAPTGIPAAARSRRADRYHRMSPSRYPREGRTVSRAAGIRQLYADSGQQAPGDCYAEPDPEERSPIPVSRQMIG